MPNYGEKKYWEERYESQKGKTFDWLEDYNSLNPIIKSLGIKKDAFILNPIMPWSEELYNIVNSLCELGWLYRRIKLY